MALQANHLHVGYVVLLIVVFSVFIGCSGIGGSQSGNQISDYRHGSEGVELQWDSSNPRTFYEGDDLVLLVDMYNRGTEDAYGELFVSGYDPSFLDMYIYPSNFFNIEGKDAFDPNGDFADKITVAADRVRLPNNRERFNQAIKLTACYEYTTYASAEVCVDPDPFNRRVDLKVCQLSSVSPGPQGHPVVINSIQPHVSHSDIRFTIEFSNRGKGDVYDQRVSFDKCAAGLDYNEVGLVYVKSVRLGGTQLTCEPLNPVRMRKDGGTIVCECRNCIDENRGAYTSLIEMELSYGYRNIITQNIEIVSLN